jgi:hypothetical protein
VIVTLENFYIKELLKINDFLAIPRGRWPGFPENGSSSIPEKGIARQYGRFNQGGEMEIFPTSDTPSLSKD